MDPWTRVDKMVKPIARCLFGSDHELTRRYLTAANMKLLSHLQDAESKWNFDFVNGRPLPGPYIWKKAGPKNLHLDFSLPEADCTKSSDNELLESNRDVPSEDTQSEKSSSPTSPTCPSMTAVAVIRPIPLKRKRDQSQQTTLPGKNF